MNPSSAMTWLGTKSRSWRSFAPVAAFVLASLAVVSAVASMLVGGAPSRAEANLWTFVLSVNFLVIAALGAHLGLRIARTAQGRGREGAAPRMHLRFAGFLSLAAVAPAVIVAVFLGAVFVLLDGWFSERIGGAIEAIGGFANQYQDTQLADLQENVRLMAIDLNKPEPVAGLRAQPERYRAYLRDQVALRGMEAAYVLDGRSNILAMASVAADAEFASPRADDLEAAAKGSVPVRLERDGRFRGLIRLSAYDNAYLYIYMRLDEDVFASLNEAFTRFGEYEETRERRQAMLALLGFVYAQMTLLVVLAAAWLGLVAASRLVRPIEQLLSAAQRVGGGDLDARVHMDARTDEMAALGSSFNQMTEQLASQRAELIEASDEAERRRRFSEAVLAGVSAGVLGVNPAGRITLANNSARALLVADSHQLVNRAAAEAAPELAGLIEEALSAKGVAEGNVDLERDGRLINLRVRAGAAQDGSGAVVVTFDDVTKLVSAQRSAAWRDVARRIAHEIKNPLTPIQLSAERLRRKYANAITNDQETFTRCVDTILRQVTDIGRMVNEFSTFARMPSPDLAPTDLSILVRDIVFAQRVAAPSLHFPIHVPEGEVNAVCDERLVGQALTNVVKNAAEAVAGRLEGENARKGEEGMVETTLTCQGDTAVIEVRDNGPGWPVAQRERLLEPYMTTREKGTGLGLAIVNRVMEDHDGRLELATRQDGRAGAVVRLVLPLAAAGNALGAHIVTTRANQHGA